MAEPSESRKSRIAWPGPMSTAGLGQGHSHELPDPLIRRIRLLTQVLVIVGVCLVAAITMLLLLILERGQMRDAEQERIREAFCDVFDSLPEGGLLDRPRALFDCGPGIPLEDLPDDLRQRWEQRHDEPAAASTTPQRTEPPPMGLPAVPDRYQPTESYRQPGD